MTEYVCGFLFKTDLVALIHKARPDWQRGRLNGIGGKIEAGETPRRAMVREFQEEAGVSIPESEWSLKLIHSGPGHRAFFFRADTRRPVRLRTDGNEPCEWLHVHALYSFPVIPNLRWIIPLCLDDDLRLPIEVYDHSNPEWIAEQKGI